MWNCEGFKRVSHDLFSICLDKDPDFLFISEPWFFQSDLLFATSFFSPKYCYSLNSDDKLDPELALTTRHAHGGVLVFWKRHLDPFISTVSVASSRFLPIIFDHPHHPTTIHIAVYLPTAGLEDEFVHELSLMEATIDDLLDKHPTATVFIRGDANACFTLRTGNRRDALFRYFCERLSFSPSLIPHETYHHFIGNTSSSIDVILQKAGTPILPQEVILGTICSRTSPQVDSKHDIILTSFQLPVVSSSFSKPEKAPQVPNTKHRIAWSDSGIEMYRNLLSPTLQSLKENWSNPQSAVSFSVLLQCTNQALTAAAKASNKVIDLTREGKPKKELSHRRF